MKFIKKTFKGFTLIELIVVIAIIGILAGILIPAMMGFLEKSKYATANANAKEIYNALMASSVEMSEENGLTGGLANQVFSKQYLRDTYNSLPDDKKEQMSVDLEGYFGVAYDSEGCPVRVAWGKSDKNTEIIGRYPDPTSVDEPANWSNWNN